MQTEAAYVTPNSFFLLEKLDHSGQYDGTVQAVLSDGAQHTIVRA
jgi:hypothetical protein